MTLFDVSKQRAKQAAAATVPAALPLTRLCKKDEKRLERAGAFLLCAAVEAVRQAEWEPSEQTPIVLGTTSGGMTLGEAYYKQALAKPQRHRQQATRVNYYLAQTQAVMVSKALGLAGPLTIIANACASGANAVGHACSLIWSGRADRVLAGGYDGLSQLVFSGFDSLQALTPTQCRPFDAKRDGLGLGEGAGMLCLESLARAHRRGAQVLGEIVGYGASTDVHHLTQPHPQGKAALQSMQAACESARVRPNQIGYLNAHGTGTPLNDSAEAEAINTWAGESVSNISVSSTKGSIGHLLGAAGAVEIVICLMALKEGWLPPTAGVQETDPICGFRLVREPQEQKIEYALSNSFGFGGANASILLRRES